MDTYKYSSIPFIRLLLPLLLGRILALNFNIPLKTDFIFTSIILLIITLLLIKPYFKYKYRYLPGLLINISLFCIGILISSNYNFSDDLFNHKVKYKLTVEKSLKNTDKKQNVLVLCEPLDTLEKNNFLAIAYIKKDKNFELLLPGNKILTEQILTQILPTGNPFAFEYSEYIKKKKIKGCFFLEHKEYIIASRKQSYKAIFYKLKQNSIKKLSKYNFSSEQLNFISAMLLGDKSNMSYEIKNSFSKAGVFHILAVSGLHVGIIYMILIFILGEITNNKKSIFKIIIILLTMWLYASITGMSESVFRATSMFSLFLISKLISKQYNVYHSLAISAFIIILLSPNAILNNGFWLSFGAVSSIIYFYPKINSIFVHKNFLIKYIWSLISVSISAQIIILPLILYWFGTFPLWFLLGNILIIPVLPFVLILGIILLLFPSEWIITTMCFGMEADLIQYIIDTTYWISNLPFAQINSLKINIVELIISYLILLFLIKWIENKYYYNLRNLLIFCLILSFSQIYRWYDKLDDTMFTIHYNKNKSIYSVVTKNKALYYTSDTLNTYDYNATLFPLFSFYGVKQINKNYLTNKKLIAIPHNNINICVINNNITDSILKQVVNMSDMLIFTSNYKKINFDFFNKNNKKISIILDSSINLKKSNIIADKINNKNIYIHNTSLQGAFANKINNIRKFLE